MTITWSDQFAGGGGFAAGLAQVPGSEVLVAGNHAQHTVATYQANHPSVRVHCADLSQTVPSAWPTTDALWSSPECTKHTVAQGKKRGHGEFVDGLFSTNGTDEAVIRSRATMHCVPRFAEYHGYLAIVVENVADAFWWGPNSRPGAAFDAWLQSVRVWGYQHRILYRNSAHMAALGPAALSLRDRMYVVFWHESVGRTPDFDKWTRPYAQCPLHGTVQAMQAWKTTSACSPARPWGKHGAQYEWRCPRNECRFAQVELPVGCGADVVDWSLQGRRIGDAGYRPNTMRKIVDGHAKYGSAPFIAELRGGGSTHRSLAGPIATVTAGGNHHLLVHGDAPDVQDRYARMLTVDERKVAMAFPKNYQLIGTAKKASDREKQMVSMVGNAVSPNVSRDLGAMVAEFITGEPIEPIHYTTAA